MLPNNHARQSMAWLSQAAIKRVYASTFCQYAKNYFKATPYRTEEEKMRSSCRNWWGPRTANRFYPDVGGSARSYNFYPAGPMAPEDGIVAVALGLAAWWWRARSLRVFCPATPNT